MSKDTASGDLVVGVPVVVVGGREEMRVTGGEVGRLGDQEP